MAKTKRQSILAKAESQAPVHKDRLQEPLGVVGHPAGRGHVHHRCHLPRLVQVAVGQPRPGVEPAVDQQRAGVLAQEHGRPADLPAAVLEVEEGAVVDAQRGQGLLVLQTLAPRLQSQLLPAGEGLLLL